VVCAPWFSGSTAGHAEAGRTLPRSVFDSLSKEGQHACRFIVAAGEAVGPFKDFGRGIDNGGEAEGGQGGQHGSSVPSRLLLSLVVSLPPQKIRRH
jgi:hypothetical protein